MPHISFKTNLPGILGPMSTYPEYNPPLNLLAESLLRKKSDMLSCSDREIIASYVSYLNNCVFCSESHGAVADAYLDWNGFAKKVWENFETAPINELLKAFLVIAKKVQKDARSVTQEDVRMAQNLGASEADIHDVVLIAAAFCMYNRYVDGLNSVTPPRGSPVYTDIGRRLANDGYLTGPN